MAPSLQTCWFGPEMEALAVQFLVLSELPEDHKLMVEMVVILGIETPPIPTIANVF